MVSKQKNFKYLYVVAFGAMFMMGIIDSMRGPMIPGIRSTFDVSYSSIGGMLFIASLGFLISTFFGGVLCDKLGQKKVMYFGYMCVILGILGVSWSMNFGMFLFTMGFLNIGLGSIEMSVNSLVSIIFVKNQAVMMNLLHFFYGVGASIGPRYSGVLLNRGIMWQKIYFFSLLMVASLLAYMAFIRFPEGTKYGDKDTVSFSMIIKDRKVLLFGIIVGFYFASELGVANWFANYLGVVYEMDELSSSFYLSVFFGVFTLGRLGGGFIAERMGYLNSILVFMTAAFLLFTGGIILGNKYVMLISFCGLSFSIVFPTLMTVILSQFKKSTSSTLGVIITMGSGINMLSNWLIGVVNDIFGVRVGFIVIIGFIAVFLGLFIALRRMIQCHDS